MSNNNKSLSKVVLFVVQPFVSAFLSLFKSNERGARIAIILFTALYGFCAVASESNDMYYYQNALADFSWTDYTTDFYRTFVIRLVSMFTTDGRVLMAVFGAVYGFLFTRCLKFFTQIDGHKYIYILSIFCFCNIFSLASLGGVRFATAFYLFCWGVLGYLYNDCDWKYLVLACSSILVHYAYIYIAVGLLVFIFLKKSPSLIICFFFLSFIIGQMNVASFILGNSYMLGDTISTGANAYADLDLEEFNTRWQSNWLSLVLQAVYYITLFLLLFLYLKFKSSPESPKIYIHSLLLLILLASFSNIAVNVPHLGLRFQKVIIALSVLPVAKLFSDNWECNISALRPFCNIYFTLFVVVALREIIVVMSHTPITIAALPLPFYGVSDTTVLEFLGLGNFFL